VRVTCAQNFASDVVSSRSYRSAALKHHPDRADDPTLAQATFVLIAEANDVLSDPERRKEYDILLSHGHSKYDAKVYAEIQNQKNQAWGRRAGFTFTSRRTAQGEEIDDTWMLVIGLLFTAISIGVPGYQWLQRRAKAAAQRKASAANLKSTMVQQRKVVEERLAAMEAKGSEKQNQAAVAFAEADEAEEDNSSTTEASAAEREERRQAKAQHKKSKLLLRTLLKKIVVEPASASAAINSKELTTKDVDQLVAHLPAIDLDALNEQLWSLLGESSSSSSSTPSALSAALCLLLPLLVPLRKQAKEEEEAAREKDEAEAERRRLAAQKSESSSSASKSSSSASTHVEWTPLELSALAKATAKFPGGVHERWERITEYVNSTAATGGPACGTGTRTMKEILAKSRETESAPLRKTDGQAFALYVEKLKAKTEGSFEPVASSSAATSHSTAAAAAAPAPIASSSTADEWTAEQQAQLENALRTVSKTAEDRWGDIAKLVPGKTKKQVVERFKYIRAQITQQQPKKA
jgi:curved DNA-binding protein CbpA